MAFAEPTNITTIYGVMEYANTVSDGYYFIFIPIGLYLVIFLYLKLEQYSTVDCMMAAGFMTAIIAVLLRIVGAIDTIPLIWILTLTALPAVVAYFSRKEQT